MVNLKAATIEPLHLNELAERNIHADVLRLDKIHPVISGNKWFKLKYYLEEAKEKNYKTILTFGGAYSNHIIAAAYAAKATGINSIGIIRGEQSSVLSHTLLQAKSYGMQLEFISRDEYKIKNEPAFLDILNKKKPGCFIIPEGGAGENGVKGSAEILDCVKQNDYTHILCAAGTGTMFAGLANASQANQKMIGICTLKGMKNLLSEFSKFFNDTNKTNDCEINYDYHFGGYAKKNDDLLQFMNSFYSCTGIPADFVYTGKLFYSAVDLIKKNHFPRESKLLIIHSGGLQGNMSLPKGALIF